MPSIVFSDIQVYLDAIAQLGASTNGTDINASPHKRFWSKYDDFMNGNVPGVLCNGNPLPVIDQTDKLKSAFYLILITSAGFCEKPQMPFAGPFITDADFKLKLASGKVVTEIAIMNNIKSWLQAGCPEK